MKKKKKKKEEEEGEEKYNRKPCKGISLVQDMDLDGLKLSRYSLKLPKVVRGSFRRARLR